MHAVEDTHDINDLSLRDNYGEVDDEYNETLSSLDQRAHRPWYARREVFYFGGFLGLVFLITAIAVPTSKAAHKSAYVGPVIFTPELPAGVVQSNKDALGNTLLAFYNTYGLNWDATLQRGSPQQLSLEWVAGSRTYAGLSSAQRVQRYALGVFYYSTFSKAHQLYNKNNDGGDATHIPGWTSSVNWISSITECDWEGVTCSADASSVVGILLPQHSLTGTLPLELAFLQSLTTIDLTSNFIYVDGDASVTAFSHLNNLETLLIGDNYVVCKTGIPPSIASMKQLQKLTMSYNILEGPLDGTIFGNLSKLTHLEIESNFLSGGIPTQIMQLPTLVYVYLRRNLLTIDLPTLLASGNLPSIFALWLDGNTVQGSIPSSIGYNHPDLASLSITNTTLQGPIPTELGLLTGLRRVWLYENMLTGAVPTELGSLSLLEVLELYSNNLVGQMPSQICNRISTAAYEFKALTVDCQEVACSCCTTCH